jgi:hypothetical protein
VGHKPESVSPVRRADTRGLDRHCPHGVFHGFHITAYNSEPFSSLRRLLSKDDCRAALSNEFTPNWPEVALVGESFVASDLGKWLAGARACPNRSVICPSRKSEGVRPSASTGEEVTLSVALEVGGPHFNNGSFVNVAIRYQSFRDQVAQPSHCVRCVLVVVRRHQLQSSVDKGFVGQALSSGSLNEAIKPRHGAKGRRRRDYREAGG